MSFGFSLGDFVLLTQLAQKTIRNAQKACDAHDHLVREVKSLHVVLRRVEAEVSKPTSILNRPDDNRKAELSSLAEHCRDVLRVLCRILEKCNALSEQKRSVTRLWKKIRFGNGEMQDLDHIRLQLATHTQAFNTFLNLLMIGSQGKVEEYMDSHGKDLWDIKQSLNWLTASSQARSHQDESILTTYSEDERRYGKPFEENLSKKDFPPGRSGSTMKRSSSISWNLGRGEHWMTWHRMSNVVILSPRPHLKGDPDVLPAFL